MEMIREMSKVFTTELDTGLAAEVSAKSTAESTAESIAELISLRELSQSVGVSRRSIQGYENEGLISPVNRNKYGHLLYDDYMRERADKVHFLQKTGFMLKEIKGIIDAPPEIMVSALEKKLPELEEKERQLSEIIRQIKDYIAKLN